MQRQDDLLNDMPIVLVGGPFCPSFLASLTPCSTRTHTHHPPFALLADFSAAQSTVQPCQPSYPPSRVPPALPGPNAAHATPDVPLRVPPWHHGGAVVAGALPATMQSRRTTHIKLTLRKKLIPVHQSALLDCPAGISSLYTPLRATKKLAGSPKDACDRPLPP